MPRPIAASKCALSLCLVAILSADSFAADEEESKPKILIIKSGAEDESHAFIKLALAPSRRESRFDITVADADYLAQQPLGDFATIFLNDVAELTDGQRQALEKAVTGGAGLCLFLGPKAKVDHYSEKLYAGGKGLLPLPLGKPLDIPEGKTGIVAAKHPALAAFDGEGQAMLNIVLVSKSHTPATDWKPEDVKGLHVIANSAAGHPLAVSKPHGDGNVVVFLFVPDRTWANWHFYPAWVIMMHELQAFMTEY